MAYTEIKERNNKKYYYRVLSIREKNRVNKKRIYLGTDLLNSDLKDKEIEADSQLLHTNKINKSKKSNQNLKNNERIAKKNILRKSQEVKGQIIEGYNFDKPLDYEQLIKNYATTGFQASHFARAIEITNNMIKNQAFIFLGYTSNMISSGLRDIIRFLVQNKKVNVCVTTTGGIEEDIIKCLGNFRLGDFRANGAELRKKGINRIGNIFAPNQRYIEFEEFFQPILEYFYQEQKRTGRIITPLDIIWKLGEKINNSKSIYYWAWKNKIPVYCPSILDGALGDNIYFFKFKHPDFKIDITEDVVWFNNTTIGLKKSGAIILGSGIIKHAILNANMLRNGLDYAVYINNAQEFDGSDAGALPEEAISWGKILPNSENIKVFGDATLLFPLLVASSFAKKRGEV
ncbi:deoxyhypusine synthase [Candidatus Pacearchaeota archaeon]|nr:deoxyhypusine synthase [Candidatus Pacearchaeota archaeon]